ncbi:unnamed protein product [Ceratitis capitata]|uniref:(Mediterranean fruit fly) hypothetical protein n=1 Tax=Ceratitis capitata TaxID=7213 RepID=A0A811V4A7_CERCA|nr:unnamed protein product [Ceratitis capitata]
MYRRKYKPHNNNDRTKKKNTNRIILNVRNARRSFSSQRKRRSKDDDKGEVSPPIISSVRVLAAIERSAAMRAAPQLIAVSSTVSFRP